MLVVFPPLGFDSSLFACFVFFSFFKLDSISEVTLSCVCPVELPKSSSAAETVLFPCLSTSFLRFV